MLLRRGRSFAQAMVVDEDVLARSLFLRTCEALAEKDEAFEAALQGNPPPP